MRIVTPFLAFLIAACSQATPPQPVTPAPAPAGDVVLPALPPATPISASEYAARRRTLLDSIGDGVLVVFGGPSPAFDYLPFAQLADFRYLTGIMEPSAAYVAVKRGATVQEHLFVLDRDPAREVWEGARLGPEGAHDRTGIPAQSAPRFEVVLDSLAGAADVLHTTIAPPLEQRLTSDHTHAQQVLSRIRNRYPDLRINTVQKLIRDQRGVKSAAELDRIRRAVHISALAHREAMRSAQPGMNEFEIRALMEYMFRRNGAEGPAYGSIVGSGPNSTTLHYQASDRFMEDGEVLLIDAAASYGGYAADVTRTFPINGTFTPDQRAIYEIVLAAQKAAAAQIRQGATWKELSDAANAEIGNGLARLGLIDAPDATYEVAPDRTERQVRMFYMHGLGHGVGLAVHDPDISQTQGRFAPGSAVTIEPGIYVRSDAFDYLPDTPGNRAMIQRLRPSLERYRNIGVRIEDVFIFDANGVERVSAAAPREIAEIEALMREPGLDDASRRDAIVDWFRGNRGR
ncbi:MAG TPA: aminopeptidase P N-terminal domain-containing protein [Longimicrobiales bacterium]|nr:aminopeptidase P N-terminal domain-containing protein [Longimicrobiales bacterium]